MALWADGGGQDDRPRGQAGLGERPPPAPGPPYPVRPGANALSLADPASPEGQRSGSGLRWALCVPCRGLQLASAPAGSQGLPCHVPTTACFSSLQEVHSASPKDTPADPAFAPVSFLRLKEANEELLLFQECFCLLLTLVRRSRSVWDMTTSCPPGGPVCPDVTVPVCADLGHC